MHQTFFWVIFSVLKSTVYGCPSACFCDGTTVNCIDKNLTTVPSGISNTTTHLWVFEIRVISWKFDILVLITGFTRIKNGLKCHDLDKASQTYSYVVDTCDYGQLF